MKLHGQQVSVPNIKTIIVLRDQGNIVFQARPLESFEEFLEVCPVPEPPVRELPGGEIQRLVESPQYKQILSQRNQQMIHYMVAKSLLETEGLEWETVDWNDPETFKNYADELAAAGFTAVEITRIVNQTMEANSLNEEAVDKAREAFLAGQQAQPEQESRQTDDQESTASGESVKGSA